MNVGCVSYILQKSPPFCCNLRKVHQLLVNPTQKGYHTDTRQTDSISCVFQRPDVIKHHLLDTSLTHCQHIAHLRQQCHNSKFVIFQEKLLKVL